MRLHHPQFLHFAYPRTQPEEKENMSAQTENNTDPQILEEEVEETDPKIDRDRIRVVCRVTFLC